MERAQVIAYLRALTPLEMQEVMVEVYAEWAPVGTAAPVELSAAYILAHGFPVPDEGPEKTVHLVNFGANKIRVIQAFREHDREIGIVEARRFIQSAPVDLCRLPPEAAEKLANELRAVGATVEVR